MERSSRRRVALVAAVGVLLGLMGNVATGTVHLSAQWVPIVWATTALLALLAISLSIIEFQASDFEELTPA